MGVSRAFLGFASCSPPAASRETPAPGRSPEEGEERIRGGLRGERERFRRERPGDRNIAREELKKVPKELGQNYDAPQPRGVRFQAAAPAGGLENPGP